MNYDISLRVYFDWDRNGVFTEETDYAISVRVDHKLVPPGQSITSTSGRVGEAKIELDNTTQRFSSLNSSSPLYSYIGNGKMYVVPVRVDISAVEAESSPSYVTAFYGIARIPSEITLSPSQPQTIEFDCRGIEDLLLNHRLRTTRASLADWYDVGVSDSDVIEYLVSTSGIGVTVDVDPGTFTLPWVWLENESILEELWKIAAASGGRLYGRADGTLAYEDATHWLTSPHTTSQQTYERDTDFGNLVLSWSEVELAEEVSVTWQGRELAEEAGVYDNDQISVAPGETKSLMANFSSPLYSITNLTTSASTSGGLDISAYVSISVYYYAQSARITITNSATVQASVRVKIEGYAFEAGPSQTIVETSDDTFWSDRHGRVRRVSGNRWVQSEAQADYLKAFMSGRQETPTLFAKMMGCPGNPDRVLGDRITIIDAKLGLSATDFWIVSISWRFSARAGFIQDFECVRCSDLYTYASSPGYFILDTDSLDGSKVVFY